MYPRGNKIWEVKRKKKKQPIDCPTSDSWPNEIPFVRRWWSRDESINLPSNCEYGTNISWDFIWFLARSIIINLEIWFARHAAHSICTLDHGFYLMFSELSDFLELAFWLCLFCFFFHLSLLVNAATLFRWYLN